jgi:hypothetical protein
MMKEEVWGDLPKTKLPGCCNRLVEFVSRFDDPVGSAHANWEEARVDHDRIQAPGIDIIGELNQPEHGRALEDFRLSIGEKDRVFQALVENPKPL